MIVEYMIHNNKPEIHIFWTDDAGHRHHEIDKNFQPYFYVDESEQVAKDERIIRVEQGEFYSIFGGKVKKIVTNLPSDVKEIRDRFKKTYEADILFPTRYTIDRIKEIKGILRVATIDIEVDDSGGMPDKEKADKEIYTCTIHDSFMNSYIVLYWRRDLTDHTYMNKEQSVAYIAYSSEEKMLQGIIDVIQSINPDIITAWNITFDIQLLINRMINLNINAGKLSPCGYVEPDREKIMGRVVFDMLTAYRKLKLKESRSNKLDAVAEEELGKHKLKHDESIKELWMENIDKLLEYNLTDVELVVEINKKLGIIQLFDEIRRLTKVDLTRVLEYSASVDCAILSFCNGRFVLPSKPKKKFRGKKIEGALVVQPTQGVFQNVIVCDVTRSYPSAMISCNLSPETIYKEGDIKINDNLKFKSSPKGVMPTVLSSLIELRNKKKNLMKQHPYGSFEYNTYYKQQFGLKSLINSFYGVMAYRGFRLYDDRVAGAVTEVGRELIKWSMKVAKENGYQVIYSDTDSIFLPAKSEILDDVVKEGYVIKNKIVASYNDFANGFGIKSHVFDMDFDKVFETLLFVDVKKKYAGKLIWSEGKQTDKIKIVGFESVRSDVSTVGKKIQENLLIMALSKRPKANIRTEMFEYIQSEVKKIKAGAYKLSELSKPSAIQKPIESYKVETMAVRAVKNSMYIGKQYLPGDKPLLLPLKKVPSGYPKMDVILFNEDSDIPKGFEPDYDIIIDWCIKSKAEGILEALGLSYDEVVVGKKQVTLW